MFAAQLPSAALEISAIKKAFISNNLLPAANDEPILSRASQEHVERIHRWIAPLEFRLGVKARVIPCAEADLVEGVAAQIKQDQVVLLANCIQSEKQALDVFRFAAVGLLAVPRYLQKKDRIVRTIYQGLSDEQIELIASRYGISGSQTEEMVVKLYLAELSALDVEPSFFERRDAFQRRLVRLVWPKLGWKSHESHYVIYRAAKTL
ncbi:hypothetical protein HF888_08430 [Bermanella marisrubri]|nr:hypothetical protein [Bermanella marisrubri]QIZ84252.1 hypothetical protein HF888_08430 [Bermanella marisrubri]